MHVKKSKIIRTVSWLDTGIFMVTSTLLVLLTVYGVIMRYCIKSPLTWLEEVQMILIVQVSFFGGSIAFRERGHICVDLLVDAFPKNCIELLMFLYGCSCYYPCCLSDI